MSQGLQRTYAIFNFVPRQQLCFVFCGARVWIQDKMRRIQIFNSGAQPKNTILVGPTCGYKTKFKICIHWNLQLCDPPFFCRAQDWILLIRCPRNVSDLQFGPHEIWYFFVVKKRWRLLTTIANKLLNLQSCVPPSFVVFCRPKCEYMTRCAKHTIFNFGTNQNVYTYKCILCIFFGGPKCQYMEKI